MGGEERSYRSPALGGEDYRLEDRRRIEVKYG